MMNKFLFSLYLLIFQSLFMTAQSAQEFRLNDGNISKRSVTQSGEKLIFNSNFLINFVPQRVSPFVALSLKFYGIKKEEINSVRLKLETLNSSVSQYIQIKPAQDVDDDVNYVSELIFLENNSSHLTIEIESNMGIDFSKHELKLRLFFPGNASNSVVDNQTQFRGSDDCSSPKAVSRSIWGASYNLNDLIQYKNIPEYTTVTHLIVHHGSSPNVAPNWAAVVASYFDYHVNTNGWSDIGYNYLVAPDGTLFVGRGGGDNVVGAHYCGKNAHTMGVCMIGTYNDVLPTDTALQTLVKILAWKAKKEKINPNGAALLGGTIVSNIDGHRSGCATDCPGEMVWNYLPQLRARVVATVNTCNTTTPTNEIEALSFKISPNCLNDGFLNCFGSFKSHTYWQITDINGRIYNSGSFLIETENFKTPIENLSVGVYLFSIRNKIAVKTEKFLKVE